MESLNLRKLVRNDDGELIRTGVSWDWYIIAIIFTIINWPCRSYDIHVWAHSTLWLWFIAANAVKVLVWSPIHVSLNIILRDVTLNRILTSVCRLGIVSCPILEHLSIEAWGFCSHWDDIWNYDVSVTYFCLGAFFSHCLNRLFKLRFYRQHFICSAIKLWNYCFRISGQTIWYIFNNYIITAPARVNLHRLLSVNRTLHDSLKKIAAIKNHLFLCNPQFVTIVRPLLNGQNSAPLNRPIDATNAPPPTQPCWPPNARSCSEDNKSRTMDFLCITQELF